VKGETMESKLCQKCQETLGLYSNSATYIHSWRHCHHEEPEEEPKEKCWCENDVRMTKIWGQIGNINKGWNILFCPGCGKKL